MQTWYIFLLLGLTLAKLILQKYNFDIKLVYQEYNIVSLISRKNDDIETIINTCRSLLYEISLNFKYSLHMK